ncbi:MAG: zinc ribbon domain-containing protein, partial [Methanobacterium sp.]
MNCSNCGEDIGEAKFCPQCGSKVEEILVAEEAPVEVSSEKYCPECNVIVEEANFCPDCGGKTESVPKEELET